VSFADLLALVIPQLERAQIPYMVTGSLASSYHGEPRATLDLDIVIDPSPASLLDLIAALQVEGFYVDEGAAREALERRSQFNAIGPDAEKVDFVIRKERPFSIEEFGRREPADLLGTPGLIVTAEDLVLAKLEWAEASDSDRQRRDVAGILATTDGLDTAYVERWAAELGVEKSWHAIRGLRSDCR
jgi:hypothetical protein